MTRDDWYIAGDRIKELVQDAVDTGDFSELGSRISGIVNDARWGFQDAAEANPDSDGTEYETDSQDFGKKRNRKIKVPGEVRSKIIKYLGFAASGCSGVMFVLVGLFAFIFDFYILWNICSVFGILCAVCFVVGISGQTGGDRAERFRRYEEIMDTRTFCEISELADGAGLDEKFVKKDLKKMIRKGLFPEGYMDRDEKILITDDETFKLYLQAEEEYDRKQEEEQIKAQKEQEEAEKEKARAAQRSPEHQELIEEGQRYIRFIHDCNDRIPGEEMTDKLNRLECVVSGIFEKAEDYPESVSDLKKMMSYYLPTTQKLLEAYCELDEQPVHGKNIESTKHEIENVLNTINTAFENLLDELYQKQAWDISTDISVLNMMLAQEGLTGKDFEKKENTDA